LMDLIVLRLITTGDMLGWVEGQSDQR